VSHVNFAGAPYDGGPVMFTQAVERFPDMALLALTLRRPELTDLSQFPPEIGERLRQNLFDLLANRPRKIVEAIAERLGRGPKTESAPSQQ